MFKALEWDVLLTAKIVPTKIAPIEALKFPYGNTRVLLYKMV
jgi:hypothetical protein